MWGLDAVGTNRIYRIVQKRGKIIDAEDYTGLRDTYPEYYPSKYTCRRYQSKSDMIKQKK